MPGPGPAQARRASRTHPTTPWWPSPTLTPCCCGTLPARRPRTGLDGPHDRGSRAPSLSGFMAR